MKSYNQTQIQIQVINTLQADRRDYVNSFSWELGSEGTSMRSLIYLVFQYVFRVPYLIPPTNSQKVKWSKKYIGRMTKTGPSEHDLEYGPIFTILKVSRRNTVTKRKA